MPALPVELSIRFPDQERVIVRLGNDESGALEFKNPLTVKDREDIRWYVEQYATRWSDEPDDIRAHEIAAQLPMWGKKLFSAVFSDDAAVRLFNKFQDYEKAARQLTVSGEHPAVLSLPWELLHDPGSRGVFLFHENPPVSIRRSFSGATDGRAPFEIRAKERLHLLFVVSRPTGVGFLDPRADPGAVLHALEKHAPGRFTWEFLRPATLEALVERLEDDTLAPVDILHFDGHGVFDRDGGLPERIAEERRTTRFPFEDDAVRDKKTDATPGSPPNTGYLVFEKLDGTPDLVAAKRLGENLHRRRVSLVVLSACQTAAMSDPEDAAKHESEEDKPVRDEPMGSVAARLTATGIPAVLAMTHSVLVATTRDLFGAFYKDLARGRGTGEALDKARRHLVNHPEKYEVRRGSKFVPLRLHDWFVPALYQGGTDVPLLKRTKGGKQTTETMAPRTNLRPKPEAGFFGRTRELWDVERWFSDKARRITITGFGGQGKTALGEEAGRWLTRAGMFEAVVFVDYSRVQSRDAVAVAVSAIGPVLGETLINPEAAAKALSKTPTLVILDNLEALDPEALRELLDAAVTWSEANGSRVLCTTRKPDFLHPKYATEGTLIHRRIRLDGLAPSDSLKWFAELMKLPPAPSVPSPSRDDLVSLFQQVRFHPLSIRVLAQQLKTRTPAELGRRLEQLLASSGESHQGSDQTDATRPELVASLQLSLDRLDAEARQVLPRLGVFQGGAFEFNLLTITEIGEDSWPALLGQLEAAALVEAEAAPGVIPRFLRFHPTLAPMLWASLDHAEQARLSAAHRARYYGLAGYLYHEDCRNPHEARAIAQRELPNLLHAVHGALDAADPDAVDFANSVNRFLIWFGLTQERDALVAKAQAATADVGSDSWYLAQSDRGEHLLAQGRLDEAVKVLSEVLEGLPAGPSYEKAMALGRLGRCFEAGERPDAAEQTFRDAIEVCDQLEQTDSVKILRSSLFADLGDVLVDQGKYAGARMVYEDGLKAKEELQDVRGQGVSLGQLGTLAMLEGNLEEARDRWQRALAFFQQLGEPAAESVAWHQLGRVFQEAEQWDEAERHYRESARIKEQLGDTVGAATTWNQLATVCALDGRLGAAEMWYEKAIEASRRAGDQVGLGRRLNNVAALLLRSPGRLADARQRAKEALAVKLTLHPGAAEIWKTYDILADIAAKEAEGASDSSDKAKLQAQANEYRRLARDARSNFAGTRHELRKHWPVIVGTIMATQKEEHRQRLEDALPGFEQRGWTNLVAALRSLLAGERNADVLCQGLDYEDSMIVEAILRGIADPETLKDLIPEEEEE